MIFLRAEITTNLIEDCFIIQIHDKNASLSWLLSEILKKYEEWHPFKVYEFEIDTINKTKANRCDTTDNDQHKLLDILNISEDEFCSNRIREQIMCSLIESEKSKLQRKEDEEKEEELRLERLRIEEEKRRKREARICELRLQCNCWELDHDKHSQGLNVSLDGNDGGHIVENTGSLDQWCSIRFMTAILPSFNKFYFSIQIVELTETTNTWKICIGAVPIEFKIKADRHWIGSQKSWSYIAGTGGKCHNSGKSIKYGATFGDKDVISVLLNFDEHNIEFFKNGKSQGIAFKDLSCAVIPAVSLTAKGCKLKLVPFLEDKYLPAKYKPFMLKNVEILKNSVAKRQYYLSNEFEALQNSIWNKHAKNMLYPRFSSHHHPVSMYFKSNGKLRQADKKKENYEICNMVTNVGSGDKWRVARSFGGYYPDQKHNAKTGEPDVAAFQFEIVNDAKSSNTWRICCGVVPIDFDGSIDKIWVGAQQSWSYIAGTGGKCYNSSQSTSYGERYTTNDKISVVLDFTAQSIEFFKNGESQGVAYTQCTAMKSGVYGAISCTGAGTFKFNSLNKSQARKLHGSGIQQREVLTSIMDKYGNIWDTNKQSKAKGLRVIERMDVESSWSKQHKDKWHCVASLLPYQTGRRYFEVELCSALDNSTNKKEKNQNASGNTWKVCIGVVPKTFDFNHPKHKLWIGAQNSWSFIIGTGGKCYNSSKSVPYAANETFRAGDKIGVLMDFDNHTLEFYKNDKSLGEAFKNLYGPVYAAVSVAINHCRCRFIPQAEAQKMDKLFLFH
eukprot:674319_1